ncbi:MAG: tetratricopeptide repeat protein [Myxococcales bacterium]|nr:tetratricopeptide repeat protein [Myxococcales bacterium]
MARSLAPALAELERLRAAGDDAEVHRRATALAQAHPDDVQVLARAAYACDRLGREAAAVTYYQRAFELGGPPDDRAGFLLGFGSTLRNVGRVDDAIAVLGQAVLEFPGDPALRAFLALALHGGGHAALALATMLEAGLMSGPTAFAPYRRALGEYQRALQEAAVPPPTPDPATPAVAGRAAPAPRPRARSTPRRASRSRRSR